VARWSGVADAYRQSFATLCAGTVDRLLSDAPDGRLLDVGSGTGQLAARAAAAGRSVVAVDADPDMVAMSGAAVPRRVLSASLPALPFTDGAFDAVTANFVVNHVADPRAAVRELARVTRPGGRLSLTIWPARPPAWGALVSGAFTAAGVVPRASERLAPELDFERSVAGLRGLVEEAGREVVVAEELRWTWEVDPEALWAGIAGGVATVGRTFLAQPPETRAAAARAFRHAAPGQATEGLLRLPATAAYVMAAG
jgi:ubiquinone/menaquinone biosynthesis C-methylase UbiE